MCEVGPDLWKGEHWQESAFQSLWHCFRQTNLWGHGAMSTRSFPELAIPNDKIVS